MAIKITVDGKTYDGIDAITVGGKVLTLAYVEDSTGGDTGGNTGGDTGGNTNLTWESGVPYSLTLVENEYVTKESGEIKPENNWTRTDYTYCYGASRIEVTGVTYSSGYNAFYDINKNFISAFNAAAAMANTVNVPENAAYFIISSTTTGINTIVVTPYE